MGGAEDTAVLDFKESGERKKKDSWLNQSGRPKGSPGSRTGSDIIVCGSRWGKKKKKSSTTQHLYSYWLKSLIWRTKVVSEEGGGLHLNALSSWAGWPCGRRRTGSRSSVKEGQERMFILCSTSAHSWSNQSGFRGSTAGTTSLTCLDCQIHRPQVGCNADGQ